MTDADARVEVDVLHVRPPGARWAVVSMIAAVVTFGVVAFTAAADPTWLRILLALLALLAVAVAALTARAGIVAGPTGLVARAPSGRARRLNWVDVHHFELRGYWRGLGVWTTDGRWVRLLQYGTFDRAAADILFRLEDHRWRSQHRLGLV